ncbi:MAG: carboxypeptidase regulatory-like domain-containing protein [Bacteroidia bacterium]|nr:carboxypeptidase regulatory-like domain-containing protein [Bacteroidia bacterium]
MKGLLCMRSNIINYLILGLLFFCCLSKAQDQNIKLKSRVELRNWDLTYKAIKRETFLSGASVKLYKANAVVAEVVSDAEGNFEINIPSSGEYTLLVEYPGRAPKKFAVNTKTSSSANHKPSLDIVGIIMSKPKKGMEYIGLNQPSVTTATKNEHLRTNIYDADYKLIQKFCTANKLGDMAMENKNYSLAKIFYLMAADMIGDEEYPKIQLKKAEEGIKIERASRVKQKSKHNKVKSAITNQKTTSGVNKNTSTKSSVETGKSTRKTRKVLGK